MKPPKMMQGRRRRLFIGLVLNAGAQALVLFANALLIRYGFDHLIRTTALSMASVAGVGLALGLMALLHGWLQRSEQVIAESLGQNYVHHLRLSMFRHITRMDHRQLQRRKRGALMLKFVGDLNAVRRWISFGLVRLVVSGAIIASTLAVLSLIAPLLAAATAAIVAAGVVFNTRVGASLREAARDTRRRRSRLSANINEKLARMAVVQAFGRTNGEFNRVRRQSNQLRRALVARAGHIGLIRGATQGGIALAVAAVLMIGVFQVAEGRTTPGTVAAALTVLGFMRPALRNLGRVYEYYQDARVAWDNILRFLQLPVRSGRRDRYPDLAPGAGALAFEKVSLPGVLKSFSAEVSAGARVAVVGPNGTGKTTLLELASGLIAPRAGRVLIDGQDIAAVNPVSLKRAVGIASPDLPLMSGTLGQNLCYRCPECDSAEVARIRRLCRVDTLVQDLPGGEATRIHEGGRNLSAGQRQRIMLARALLGTPRLLLLDEVDAHLDADARGILDEILHAYPGTVIMVTHHPAPLAGIDTIWQIGDGRVRSRPKVLPVLRAAGNR
jgi:ABC-type multidrug transport system fused ATPase/permease subunit